MISNNKIMQLKFLNHQKINFLKIKKKFFWKKLQFI